MSKKMLVVRNADNNDAESIIVDVALIPLATASEEEKEEAAEEGYTDSWGYNGIEQGDRVIECNYYNNPENRQNAIHNRGIIFVNDVDEIEAEMFFTITNSYCDWTSEASDAIESAKNCGTKKELNAVIAGFKKLAKGYKSTDVYKTEMENVIEAISDAYNPEEYKENKEKDIDIFPY